MKTYRRLREWIKREVEHGHRMADQVRLLQAESEQTLRERFGPPRYSYHNGFPLSRLQPGQFVRSAGDGTGACEVGNDTDGWRRINIGDPLP